MSPSVLWIERPMTAVRTADVVRIEPPGGAR